MSDNITLFPGGADMPENPMQLAPRRPGWCRHDAVILDEHARTIQCADPNCGAALDAFDFLRGQAHTIQSAWDAYRIANHRAGEIVERVSALKKEEQRLRAMVKRLQDKTGAVVATRPQRGAL